MGIASLHPSYTLSCVLCRPCDIPATSQQARVREEVVAQAALTEHDRHDSSVRLASWLSATPRRAATRIALHAGAIPHQREVPAFAAHFAFVALCLGFGAAFGF